MKVCLISEGSYPVFQGGLSEWAHLLIKKLKDVEFEIFCIVPTGEEEQHYEKLPNVNEIIIKPVIGSNAPKQTSPLPKAASMDLANSLRNTLRGAALNCDGIVKLRKSYPVGKWWLTSRDYWDSITGFYEDNYPERSFVEYFWTTFGLYSILLDIIYSIDKLPRADIYHAISSGLAGFIGGMAKALHGSPLVVTEQGLYLRERQSEFSKQDTSEYMKQQLIKFSESMTKTSYLFSDHIVPPCYNHIVTELEAGADLGKIKVIDNGIECNRFRPGLLRPGLAKNKAPLLVGCLARVVPIKGITTFIRAAGIVLEKHQANFAVIGEVQDEEYYLECQELVKELGLGDHFQFIGHANSLTWYHRIDIFVLSSLSEGVPYSLLEAMCCGLPCVCTAVGGVPEILSDNGTGYLVPPNEPESLAGKICELLGNETLRGKMGQRAREFVNEKYTAEKTADEFYKVYERLLNGNSKL